MSRRWSSPTGTVLAEGSFLSFDDDKVRVRLSSGKIGRIALSKLSAEDQQYVQEQLARDGIFGEPGQGFEIEADDRGEREVAPLLLVRRSAQMAALTKSRWLLARLCYGFSSL